MPAPKDFGDALGRVGTWFGDVMLGEKQKRVEPSYQIDYGQMDEDRARQAALYSQLQAMAAGNGPSLAQGQLQQATDQNISQAMALGAAQQGQGLGYSSALRGIADQSAQARQQAAAQSAMIRNAEQMQGMQGMGALGGQMFGQDLARQGLGAQTAYGYDAMNVNAGKRSGGILPGLLQAGGAVLGGFLGGPKGAAAGGAAGGALGGGLTGGGAGTTIQNGSAVGGGGFRGPGLNDPAGGDWTSGNVAHASSGGRVPGYASGGDSSRNDTVKAMLSPGEIVIPRSITMAPNAGELSRMFVEEVQRRRQKGSPSMEHPYVRQAGRKAA